MAMSGVGISPRTAQIVSDALMRARRQYRADPCIYSELLNVEAAVLANSNSNKFGIEPGVGIRAPMGDNEGMSVTEAAERCGMTPQALRRAITSGRLKGTKSGGIWLVGARELAKFQMSRREKGK
jgi:hypothetical protein